MMHHLAKSSQMKAVCAWLSHDRLPILLESFARVHLWVREPAPERLACVLLNASLDPLPDATFRLANVYKTCQWTGMDGSANVIKPLAVAGSESQLLQTPTLEPWSISLLTARR